MHVVSMRGKICALILAVLVIFYIIPHSYASPSIILDLINMEGKNSIRVNVYFNSSTDGYLDQIQLIMNNTVIAEWHVYSNSSPVSYIKVVGNITGFTSFKARAHFSKYGWVSSDYLYVSNNMLTTTTPPSSLRDVIMFSSLILIGIALYLLFVKKWIIKL
jgi:hypothetical protein